MGNKTKISWTSYTWNPVTGCSKISRGCQRCYAEALSLRFGWSPLPWTEANAAQNIVLHPERLELPYKYRPGSRVFVNSMSDLFHVRVPDEFIVWIFRTMAETPAVTYQILTKRAERMAAWPVWPPNVWMGVSIENARELHRLEALRRCHAAVRWISFEPLVGPVSDADLTDVDWVVVGGESGPGFERMDHAWAHEIRDKCLAGRPQIPFFFKQDSSFRPETRPWMVEADGSRWRWQQYPGDLAQPECVDASKELTVVG